MPGVGGAIAGGVASAAAGSLFGGGDDARVSRGASDAFKRLRPNQMFVVGPVRTGRGGTASGSSAGRTQLSGGPFASEPALAARRGGDPIPRFLAQLARNGGGSASTAGGSGSGMATGLRLAPATEDVLGRLGAANDDLATRLRGLQRDLPGIAATRGRIRDAGDEFVDAQNELIADVRPGFGRLTEARLQQIENARSRAVGNLRENLARRRVLGSSFGRDALARTESEFAQQSERAAAQGFLQELDATNRLIQQRLNARQNTVQRELDAVNSIINADLGLSQAATEAETATDKLRLSLFRDLGEISANLATNTASNLSENARLNAALAADSAAGAGRFFEPAISGVSNAVSEGISGLFDSGGSSGLEGTISPSTGFT